ncbi:MAG: hypothetical protein AAB393_12840, partial [Bacteroidota bacterium]
SERAPDQTQASLLDLASFVVSSSSTKTADTYYEYDAKTKFYHHYTLLQTRREPAANDVSFYGEASQQRQTSSGGALREAILAAPGLQEDTYARRDMEGRKRLYMMMEKLPQDLQKRLTYAIQLRKDGNLKQASVELSYVTKKDSTIIDAWHNLALLNEQLTDSTGAAKAYVRALRMAEKTGVSNAQLWRDYGLYLYKYRSYTKALDYLKRVNPVAMMQQGK